MHIFYLWCHKRANSCQEYIMYKVQGTVTVSRVYNIQSAVVCNVQRAGIYKVQSGEHKKF